MERSACAYAPRWIRPRGWFWGATVSVTASGSDSVRAMSMVCSDKTALALEAGCQSSWCQGLTPEIVATDGGTEFISGQFRAAIADLGSEYETGPAATPRSARFWSASFTLSKCN